MGGNMGSQFMGQQAYGDSVSKGYSQPVMYGRPNPAYNPASAYGGRYAASQVNSCRDSFTVKLFPLSCLQLEALVLEALIRTHHWLVL